MTSANGKKISQVVPLPPKTKYITREELARHLGLSLSEIRRKESSGVLEPDKRNERGTPLYAVNRLRAIEVLVAARRAASTMVPYDAEDAKKVYQALRENKSENDIVIELGLHPHVVRSIMEDYARGQGTVIIDGTIMARINALPLDGILPITTGEEMLGMLTEYARDVCKHCKKRPRQVCTWCTPTVARKMAAEG